MREDELKILEEYDIDVKNTRKVRDAILCETDKGLFLVKELCFSEKRLAVLEQLGTHLRRQGCENVDWLLKTKDGENYSVSEDGTKYFLKRWFGARECDIQKEKDVLTAARNLTKIHRALKSPFLDEEGQIIPVTAGENLQQEYTRHNREMKKVRTFMREKVGKGDFELTFLKCFDEMFAYADFAVERLKESNYEKLFEASCREHTLIHGDYNYHNVLMLHTGEATTNFEHTQENIQVTDLYYFLRKVMEKHHWDVGLGDKILNSYGRVLPYRDGELDYIAISLAYPEKFWKAANSYYRSRKVWIPAKNFEKLEMVIKQTEEKKEFLNTLFSFHL